MKTGIQFLTILNDSHEDWKLTDLEELSTLIEFAKLHASRLHALPITDTHLTQMRAKHIINTHLCAFTFISTRLEANLYQAIFVYLSSSALFGACAVYQLRNNKCAFCSL